MDWKLLIATVRVVNIFLKAHNSCRFFYFFVDSYKPLIINKEQTVAKIRCCCLHTISSKTSVMMVLRFFVSYLSCSVHTYVDQQRVMDSSCDEHCPVLFETTILTIHFHGDGDRVGSAGCCVTHTFYLRASSPVEIHVGNTALVLVGLWAFWLAGEYRYERFAVRNPVARSWSGDQHTAP